jgi:hypothetical protein
MKLTKNISIDFGIFPFGSWETRWYNDKNEQVALCEAKYKISKYFYFFICINIKKGI